MKYLFLLLLTSCAQKPVDSYKFCNDRVISLRSFYQSQDRFIAAVKMKPRRLEDRQAITDYFYDMGTLHGCVSAIGEFNDWNITSDWIRSND
jgi:hypothetical protein